MGSDTRPGWTFPAWLALLAISVLINYVDRGNLAVAAPLLKDELHLSATQIGVLITAFFWTYTVVLVLSGWVVDRYDVNWVLAGGFALWSVATAVTGIAYGFTFFLVTRLLLGVGESVAFPSYCKIIARNVPQPHRGTANAAIMTGMSLGPAIGTYICGLSMARFGWRPVFVAIGVASLLWIVPWLWFKPQSDRGNSEVRAKAGPSVAEILRQRNFWAASAGHLFSNYPLYFLIVWLPLYLVHERHLTMQRMAIVGTLYYLAFAVMAPVAGWIADACIRAGSDVTVVRKTSMLVGHCVVAVGVLAAGSADPHIYIAGLIVMGLGSGCIGPNIYVYAQTLAGPAVAGKWIGMQNGLGNLAGVIVGPLTGWIVDRTGHFDSAFTICAATPVLAAIFWVLLVGRVEQTAWAGKAEVLQAAEQVA